ncbi:MAG: polyketide synthase [Polyangiaceae bacterium]
MSVAFVQQASGIGIVEMRDTAGRNAMSERFVRDLARALDEAAAWQSGKVIVLTGLSDIFSSGADRETLHGLASGRLAPTDILLPKLVLDMPIPVVAAMEGHAVGGGLALGLSCDLAVLARESRYGATFMNMGFTPGMGATGLFSWALSPALVAELLFTGALVRGRDLEGRAGVNAIVPKAEVLPRALDLAERIAEKPRRALELLKRTLSLPRRQAFESTLTIESLMHEITLRDPAARAGIEEQHAE